LDHGDKFKAQRQRSWPCHQIKELSTPMSGGTPGTLGGKGGRDGMVAAAAGRGGSGKHILPPLDKSRRSSWLPSAILVV